MRTLYHYPLLPSCRKIRILLAEKGLPFELKAISLADRKEELFALNPSGDVPVLVEDEGLPPVAEGYAITEYLEEAYPGKRLLGDTNEARAEVRRLVGWFEGKFDREVTQNVLFEKIFKRMLGYGWPNSEAIRAGKINIAHHLDYIGFLCRERKWLAGDEFSLADIAAAAHLSALDYFGDVPWEHNAPAKEWYALVKSRPSLRPLLSDRITGFKPAEHYENPDF